jgi:hypothetical protein
VHTGAAVYIYKSSANADVVFATTVCTRLGHYDSLCRNQLRCFVLHLHDELASLELITPQMCCAHALCMQVEPAEATAEADPAVPRLRAAATKHVSPNSCCVRYYSYYKLRSITVSIRNCTALLRLTTGSLASVTVSSTAV